MGERKMQKKKIPRKSTRRNISAERKDQFRKRRIRKEKRGCHTHKNPSSIKNKYW